MKNILIGIAVLGVLAAGAAGYLVTQCEDDWCFVFEWQKIKAADSFERCAQLGFPVMESYPRQCRAGDKHFVEKLESAPQGQ